MKWHSILLALRLPKVPKHTRADRKRLERRAVIHAANGNILMQQGKYLTKEDIVKAKKRLLASL